jgi:Ca2+-binding RTX toxin-like protein
MGNMAKYSLSGNGTSLFAAYNSGTTTVPLAGRLLYVNSGEFGFVNADGSTTYVKGNGFVWDKALQSFTGGTITNIAHYDSAGRFIDDLGNPGSGLTAASLQTALNALNSNNTAVQDFLMAGNDLLDARFHRSANGTGVTMSGGQGDDTFYGSRGIDILFGGTGEDTISGYSGNDYLYGSEDNDRLFGGAGNDTLDGGTGYNRLNGGSGDDTLLGAYLYTSPTLSSTDIMTGGAGNDTLWGYGGNDRMLGGAGADTMWGGSGNDIQSGGSGADTFVFQAAYFGPKFANETWGNDRILDFEVGVDHLQLIDMMNRPFEYFNDANGHAVVKLDDGSSVTLIGVDAAVTALDDLLI